MRTLLAFLCSLLLVAGACAQSPYAGKYLALSYSNGNVVAATNIKIKKNGRIKGHGIYTGFAGILVSFAPIKVTGQVQSDGSFTISETSILELSPYSGKVSSDGNTFSAHLSTGSDVEGVRVSDNFPVAGVYRAETDLGVNGVFVITADQEVFGSVYDPVSEQVIAVTGSANLSGFEGETDSGVAFSGVFNGSGIYGTYSDGQGYEGTFSGGRL